MPKQAMDYSKTIIYKIVCNDLKISETYVGHTTNMVKRRYSHKSICSNDKSGRHDLKIYQTIRANGGWDNWNMVQICEFPCDNLEQARAEERKHYEQLNASLNTVNPCRSKKEYYDDNRNIIRECKREQYQSNRDTYLQKVKEYYNANRDARIKYRRDYCETNKDKMVEKHTCCCGSIVRHCGKARHEKSHKHLEYVKHNFGVQDTL